MSTRLRTTLDQWATLAEIVDRGSFVQAADALHRGQSTLSYTIRQLQDQLGVQLLRQQGRRAVLTPAGEELLRRGRALLQDARALEALAASLGRGWEAELRLVVDQAFPEGRLMEALRRLKADCGETRLTLRSAVLSGGDEAIARREADVVITAHVPANVLGDRVLDVEFIAVAHRDHPLLSAGPTLTPDALALHTQAVVSDSGTDSPRDEGWLGSRYRWTVSSLDASLAAVRSGLAFAWLPEHLIAADLASGTLRRLPLAAGATRRVPLYAVLVDPVTAGPAARLAIDIFRSAGKEA